MTLIEFFEKDAIENVCTCFFTQPDRVLLIGDNADVMAKHIVRYKEVLSAHGRNVEFLTPRSINRHKLQNIVDVLTEIVGTYNDCVFDLTGGDDLFLVATGIVYASCAANGMQLHRINIRNNVAYDCDLNNEPVMMGEFSPLTVEENIRLYGGDIAYEGSGNRPTLTYRWQETEEFKQDIDRMWDICKTDISAWNAAIGTLNQIEAYAMSNPSPVETISKAVSYTITDENLQVFRALAKAGILTKFSLKDNLLTICYKDAQVKRCLEKEGQVLEMKIWRIALDACEKNGTKTYHDVLNGVSIDWDGIIEDTVYDTYNEIDIMMLHGMVPVFVSCKNGHVHGDELFKLHAVATRFGGKYAKKVLVAPNLRQEANYDHIRQRSDDLNIHIVDDILDADNKELQRVVRSLWKNS